MFLSGLDIFFTETPPWNMGQGSLSATSLVIEPNFKPISLFFFRAGNLGEKVKEVGFQLAGSGLVYRSPLTRFSS